MGQVRAIVGEYHARNLPGFGRCGPDELAGFLRGEGFEVVPTGPRDTLGLFWAWRPGQSVLGSAGGV